MCSALTENRPKPILMQSPLPMLRPMPCRVMWPWVSLKVTFVVTTYKTRRAVPLQSFLYTAATVLKHSLLGRIDQFSTKNTTQLYSIRESLSNSCTLKMVQCRKLTFIFFNRSSAFMAKKERFFSCDCELWSVSFERRLYTCIVSRSSNAPNLYSKCRLVQQLLSR